MTDQTHCREFTAAEVEVEAAYIGQFHSEQAARTRDMLEAYARILRNTRAQASAPEGGDEVVCEVVAHMRDIDGEPRIEWTGEGGPYDLPDGTPLFVLSGHFDTEEGWTSLYTRSNAKAGEVESHHASDEDIRAWVDRHDLALSITSAREAFEDAATAHLLALSAQRGDGSEMGGEA